MEPIQSSSTPRLGQAGTASQLNAISCAQLGVSAQQIQLCPPYTFLPKRTSKRHHTEQEATAKCITPAHQVSKCPLPPQTRQTKQAAANCFQLSLKAAEVSPTAEEAKGPGNATPMSPMPQSRVRTAGMCSRGPGSSSGRAGEPAWGALALQPALGKVRQRMGSQAGGSKGKEPAPLTLLTGRQE